jgi:hypothetical protein
MQKHYATRKHKHQKMYKMRGCSKACTRNHRHKRGHLGGTNTTVIAAPQKALGADFSLAYPYNGPVVPNPALAYSGKGGYKSQNGIFPEPSNLAITRTSNVNGANPLYPNTGPPYNGFNFLNPVNQQRGGSCGCGMSFMKGGSIKKHRQGCKCSLCKKKKQSMTGGGGCTTGNNGIQYPNGLVGRPFVNPSNLPGANGITGDANYYSNNTYNNDVSRQMVDVGANKPFLGFSAFKGGKRHTHTKKSRKQCGGTLSNFIGQDLINLGRQITYGAGSAFNALNGYQAPVNPLPWKDQLVAK